MPANNKARWRNRVLILSLVGIAALTLFPYRFSYSLRHHPQPSFLLLRLSPKHASLTDFILNVLLFVPLGFAVALRTRGGGGGLWRSFLLALAAGAIVSYSVEFLQLFVPTRDSSWDDVFSNTTGAVAGAFLFEVVKLASQGEDG